MSIMTCYSCESNIDTDYKEIIDVNGNSYCEKCAAFVHIQDCEIKEDEKQINEKQIYELEKEIDEIKDLIRRIENGEDVRHELLKFNFKGDK